MRRNQVLSLGCLSFGAALAGRTVHWLFTESWHQPAGYGPVALMIFGLCLGVSAGVYGLYLQLRSADSPKVETAESAIDR